MIQKLLLLALAGALGTLARYGLAGAAHRWFGSGFPWGTALVNIAGCFAFGIIWTLTTERAAISPELRTVILIGFLGSFTTFSTFIAESHRLMSDAEILLGLANVALQVVAGLAMFYVGLLVGRAF